MVTKISWRLRLILASGVVGAVALSFGAVVYGSSATVETPPAAMLDTPHIELDYVSTDGSGRFGGEGSSRKVVLGIPDEVTIDEAARILTASGRQLYVPTDLPQGSVLTKVTLDAQHDATLYYDNGRVGLTLAFVRGASPTVPPRSVREVNVGGRDGYLTGGEWLIDSQTGRVQWVPTRSPELILETGDGALWISGLAGPRHAFPETGVDEATLLSVAESLQPYLGR